MANDIGAHLHVDPPGASDAQLNKLLNRVRLGGAEAASVTREDTKIAKAGKDFESILLGSWLQQAEQSFAKVPGGDGEDEEDAGKDQFQGIAMQALAGSLTASGGIGIARMITKHLKYASTTVRLPDKGGQHEP